MANQQLEALEGRFAAQSNKLHEQVLDLNCSMSDVAAIAKGIMNMRNQLMGMYGVPADPEWNPNAPAAGSASSSGVTAPTVARMRIKAPAGAKGGVVTSAALQTMDPDEVDWKSLLNTAMNRTHGVLTKDAIVYTMGGSVAEGGFWCTVSSAKYLQQEHCSAMPCATKKAAEIAAAMAAVQAEYADTTVSSVPKRNAAAMMAGAAAAGGVGPVATAAADKSAIIHLVQAVLGRPLTKVDVVYAVDESSGAYVGSVSFPGIDPAQSFTAPPAATRKEAENAAARACLPWLQSVAGPALEQQQAKKAKKTSKTSGQQKDKPGKPPAVIHAAKTPGAQVPVGQARPAVQVQMGAQQIGLQQFAAQQLGAQLGAQFGAPQPPQPGMQNMVNMAGNVGRWGW